MASPARGPRNFGLGRGLDALIPSAGDERGVLQIAIDRIERNPDQPRSTFDEDLPQGSGLRGLCDRLATVEGSIEIWSCPGAGTRLRARIPLTPGTGVR